MTIDEILTAILLTAQGINDDLTRMTEVEQDRHAELMTAVSA